MDKISTQKVARRKTQISDASRLIGPQNLGLQIPKPQRKMTDNTTTVTASSNSNVGGSGGDNSGSDCAMNGGENIFIFRYHISQYLLQLSELHQVVPW